MKNYMFEWQGPSHMPVLYSEHTLPSHRMATEYASQQFLTAIRNGFKFHRVVVWHKEVEDGEVLLCAIECRLEAKVITDFTDHNVVDGITGKPTDAPGDVGVHS